MTGKLIVAVAIFFSVAALADDGVYVQVLGVTQDAGYPQLNCYQPHCNRAWQDPASKRLASSIALIDRRSKRKFLFDATPDIREQMHRLHIAAADDDYALNGVFLTHAHIGHYTGLMHFGHEAAGTEGVPVFAMPRMHDFLSSNGPWDQLVRYGNIELRALQDGACVLLGEELAVTPFLVPHRDEYSETVGYRIDGPNRSVVFIPDIDKWAQWDTDIRDVVRSVDYALLDATFFADGELSGRDMSAIPHPFAMESMALFEELTDDEKSRVIFIHMNHTNPLLIDGSPEQAEVEERGFRFAREGMRLEL
jgi:pyrroloquinoline quinone biosynthesis protein B